MNQRNYLYVSALLGVVWNFVIFWLPPFMRREILYDSGLAFWIVSLVGLIVTAITLSVVFRSVILDRKISSFLLSVTIIPVIGAVSSGLIIGILTIPTHSGLFREISFVIYPTLAVYYLVFYWYLVLFTSTISVIALRKVSGLPAIPPRKRAGEG
jgi:hypothetical protein